VSSFVYGIIPDHPFDYALDVSLNTGAKAFNLKAFLENMELKTNVCKFSTPFESSDCKIDIVTHSGNDDREVRVLSSASTKLCPDYFAKQINKYKALAQGLMHDDKLPLAVKMGVSSFLENPERYLPNSTSETQIDFDVKLSLSESNHKMN